MIPKLHYFNPGHETAVLSSSRHYTPSVTVRKMMKDLAVLPCWYADPGDYVLIKEMDSGFGNEIRNEIIPNVKIVTPHLLKKERDILEELLAVPWGISPQILQFYTRLKEEYHLPLSVPLWRDQFYSLTSRQTAAACLHKVKEKLPGFPLPSVPLFFSDINELENFIEEKQDRIVIKTPFSSSGRGLLWPEGNKLEKKEKEWIKGAICKQRIISVEDRLTRLQDYGWQFYLDKEGSITYLGIVPFSTTEKGLYKGSAVQATEQVEHSINALLGGEVYQQILTAVTNVIQELYAGYYNGYLGVDMMLYETPSKNIGIHPCVEINMRCTMGLVALKLQALIHPETKGYFFISYDKIPDECKKQHLSMQETYPLCIEDKKIKKGYYSLCPVEADTQYRAYLITF